MKIVFDLTCGIGNNGGCRTILLSSMTLNKLGHNSYTYCPGGSRFTWFDHPAPLTSVPEDVDILLATAWSTVQNVVNFPCRKKGWWIRGHETWGRPDNELVKLYKDKRITKLVNSRWLQKYLIQNGVGPEGVFVVHQGLDFHLWKDRKLRENNKKVRIGCLYNPRHKTKRWEDFRQLASILGSEKYEYAAMGEATRSEEFLTTTISNPTHKQLVDFYSSCHIWFAPTSLEGLHNPPMEAALCGALLVCSNYDFNGMIHDYAFNGKTAHVFTNVHHAAELIKNADFNLANNMRTTLVDRIGTREYNMERLVNIFNKT